MPVFKLRTREVEAEQHFYSNPNNHSDVFLAAIKYDDSNPPQPYLWDSSFWSISDGDWIVNNGNYFSVLSNEGFFKVYQHRKNKRLTKEVIADILAYLEAHKWLGAKKAIAAKHGTSIHVISKLLSGKTYRGRK